jgi:hypothetical protein
MQDATKITCVSRYLSPETLVSRNFKLQLRKEVMIIVFGVLGQKDMLSWCRFDTVSVTCVLYVDHGFFECLRLSLGTAAISPFFLVVYSTTVT